MHRVYVKHFLLPSNTKEFITAFSDYYLLFTNSYNHNFLCLTTAKTALLYVQQFKSWW